MGCIARLGCLLLLLCLLALAWLTRDRWLRVVHLGSSPATSGVVWEPLTPQRAERARRALQRLGQPSGPVFTNLTGGEAASYVYRALANDAPRAADSAEAAVIGDRLYLRASTPVRELGGSAVLGPIASLLGDRERVQFGGTFSIVRPGWRSSRCRTSACATSRSRGARSRGFCAGSNAGPGRRGSPPTGCRS